MTIIMRLIMKRVYRKLLFILTVLFIFLTFANTANAETLIKENTNYYFTRYDPSSGVYTSDVFKKYFIDGVVAYCIEPNVHEGNSDYVLGNLDDLKLTQDVKERILLIGYYGYSYPNHDNLKMRMATQALIWEAINGEDSWVKFSTGLWNKGELIDIESEKNEIMNLVNKHSISPNIEFPEYLTYGMNLKIDNIQDIIDNYNIQIDNGFWKVDNDALIIEAQNTNPINVNLVKKEVYSSNYKIFVGDDIQKILAIGNGVNKQYHYTIKVLSPVYLEVQKTASDNISNLGSLKGAKYEVYKEDGTFVLELVTDENGFAKSDAVLSLGKYYIKEKEAPYGYLLDEEIHEFVVTPDSSFVHVDVKDKPILGKIIIDKKIEIINYNDGNFNYDMDVKSGISFDIYDVNNRYIETISTDKDGIAETTLLPLGKYIIKEHYSKDYIVEEVIVELKQIDSITQLVEEKIYINNYFKKGNIHILKKDLSTGEVIPNTYFELYDDSGVRIYAGFTDLNGHLNIENIKYGEYKLIEVASAKGYTKSDEVFLISVSDDNSDIQVEMYNVKVPKTGKYSCYINKYSLSAILKCIYYCLYEKIKHSI